MTPVSQRAPEWWAHPSRRSNALRDSVLPITRMGCPDPVLNHFRGSLANLFVSDGHIGSCALGHFRSL